MGWSIASWIVGPLLIAWGVVCVAAARVRPSWLRWARVRDRVQRETREPTAVEMRVYGVVMVILGAMFVTFAALGVQPHGR